MILPEQAVPGLSLQLCLPPAQYFLQVPETDRVIIPFSKGSGIQLHVFKVEHHVQLMGLVSRILHRLPGSHAHALSHGHPVKPRQDFPVHLLQIRMNPGAIGVIGKTVPIGIPLF